MYFDFLVKIPDVKGKIYEKTIKGVTYINYEYDRIYKPEKKYNIPKRTTIGKKSDEAPDMMYPNPNFLTYFPDAELPEFQERDDRSSCLHIGSYLVIQKLIMESMIDRIVNGIYDDDRGAGLFLDLASYYLVTENNAGQYYPDYAYNHPLFTADNKIYSDSTVSKFISEISVEDSVAFQNEWNANKKKTDRIYISYDSTNKNCQAGEIDLAEFGHAKDDKGLPIVNYSIAYDCKNREPLFYEDYPGSIVDVSQLQCMLDKAKSYGYKKAGFILDRGYFSRENIRYIDKCGYDFVIMVKGMRPFVCEQVKKVRGSFESEWATSISRYQVNGTTVKTPVFYSDEKERYFHIYYSYVKAASEKALLEKTIHKTASYLKKMEGQPIIIDKKYGKYFSLEYYHEGQEDQCFVCGIPRNDVISQELQMCGYFCIITSAEMTAKEALELYLVIPPHQTILIPTGIATVFSSKWVALLRERGSNGSKGLAQRAGVIDSGYRGEWFVPLTNTNRVPIVIVKKGVKLPLIYENSHAILYPYEKGIAQLLMVEVPKLRTKEISYEELLQFNSERGTGALGSSGK